VVIGARGVGGYGASPLGHVARSVAMRSPVPVTLVQDSAQTAA
jgi:nucleotide-binding universal stress UspA family protein